MHLQENFRGICWVKDFGILTFLWSFISLSWFQFWEILPHILKNTFPLIICDLHFGDIPFDAHSENAVITRFKT